MQCSSNSSVVLIKWKLQNPHHSQFVTEQGLLNTIPTFKNKGLWQYDSNQVFKFSQFARGCRGIERWRYCVRRGSMWVAVWIVLCRINCWSSSTNLVISNTGYNKGSALVFAGEPCLMYRTIDIPVDWRFPYSVFYCNGEWRNFS